MKSSNDLIVHFFFSMVPHLASVICPSWQMSGGGRRKASLPIEQSLRLLGLICGQEKCCVCLVKLLLSKGKWWCQKESAAVWTGQRTRHCWGRLGEGGFSCRSMCFALAESGWLSVNIPPARMNQCISAMSVPVAESSCWRQFKDGRKVKRLSAWEMPKTAQGKTLQTQKGLVCV